MSASREKNLRQQGKAELSKKEKALLEQKKQQKKLRVSILIVTLCVALMAASVVFVHSALIRRIMPAAVIDGHTITVAEFQYYYHSVFSQLYSDASQMYGDYVSYLMPTSTAYAKSVSYDDSRTWHDYLVDEAANSISGVYYYSQLAQQAGYTLSEDDAAQIAAAIEAVEYWADYNGQSVNAYLADSFGKGITLEIYQRELERVVYANSYKTYISESYTYSDDQLESYYGENKDDLAYYTFRAVHLYLADQDSYDEANTDAAWEELRAEWDEIEAAMEGGADFYEAITPYMNEADVEEFNTDDNAKGTAQGANLNSSYADWVKDASRAEGDTTCIEAEDGMYIVEFISRDDNDYTARSMYAMIYTIPVSSTDYASDEEFISVRDLYTQMADDVFDEYYQQWLAAGGTVEAFGQIAITYGEETGYDYVWLESTLKNEYGEASEWLYDFKTLEGNVTKIYSEELGGYCMICYAGEGMEAWEYIATVELSTAAYEEWETGQEADRTIAYVYDEKFWSRLVG